MKKLTLKQLSPIIKFVKRENRPILASAKVENNTLTVSDLETTIKFYDVDLTDGLHNVETLHLQDSPFNDDISEYPTVCFNLENQAEFSVPLSELEAFLPFISKDETRLHLQSLAYVGTDLVATDGYKLRMLDNMPENNLESSLIPRKSVELLVKLMKKYKMNEASIYFTDSFAEIKTERFSMLSRLIQRDYPKYSAVIPVKNEKEFTLTDSINFKELKPLFNRSFGARISAENGDVILEIVGSNFKQKIGTTEYDFEFGVNASYFDVFVSNSKSNVIKLNNELSPVFSKGDNVTTVVMPLIL